MVPTTYYARVPSPLGPLLLVGTEQALTAIGLPSGSGALAPDPAWIASDAPFADAVRQLDAYFAGTRRGFDLPLAPTGTAFQQRVWGALLEVPYGQTESYSALARRIGHPEAVRAVGAANGRNPLPIVIPCHRVIGQDGRLVGYGGGLRAKEILLDLERRVAGVAAPGNGGRRRRARQTILFPAAQPEGVPDVRP